jgi:hypothetical protein
MEDVPSIRIRSPGRAPGIVERALPDPVPVPHRVRKGLAGQGCWYAPCSHRRSNQGTVWKWDGYGWPEDEVPAEVEEDVILSRLLAVNGERAG